MSAPRGRLAIVVRGVVSGMSWRSRGVNSRGRGGVLALQGVGSRWCCCVLAPWGVDSCEVRCAGAFSGDSFGLGSPSTATGSVRTAPWPG